MDQNDLINCFLDTLEVAQSVSLRKQTAKAARSSSVYKEDFRKKHRKIKSPAGDIILEENTTFAAAKSYVQNGKVCVLNFANPHNPGGGVQVGAMAQEECLCRSSNLFLCLNSPKVFNEYYQYQRNLEGYIFSDRLIYTKKVTVFKDDSAIPQLMDQKDWFFTDVITCAAPYLSMYRYFNQKVLKELLKNRIRNIFEAAADNGVEVLVLGAFGCGAFRNPPDVVAEAFYESIAENQYIFHFKKIVFAIKRTASSTNPTEPCQNLLAFERVFRKNSAGLDNIHIYSAEMEKQQEDPHRRTREAAKTIGISPERLDQYECWRTKNPYYKKQFSILGDSVSTLFGYHPSGYNVFYTEEMVQKSGVRDYADTWWGKVIEFFGGELLVNNSWSGSRVTMLEGSDQAFPSGCSDERTFGLHTGSVTPDVIIVYLGTNDWGYGAKTGDESGMDTDDERIYFRNAYRQMLSNLKQNYPCCEIWCCTLSETFMSKQPEFVFPHQFAGKHMEEYDQMIRETVQQERCRLIDLYRMKMPYDSVDGSHPNREGMFTLASGILHAFGDPEIDGILGD